MLISLHPEIAVSSLRQAQGKSEPFDGLRMNSAKNLSDPSDNETIRRPAGGGTPQNDTQSQGFRMGISYQYLNSF